MEPTALTPALAQAALLVLKSTLLLGAAALGARGLCRASAATRHLVWSLALGGTAVLPLLVLLLPDWKPAALAILRPTVGASGGWAAAAGPRLPLELVVVAVWAAGTVVVLARLLGGLMAVRHLARGAQVVDDPEWTDLLERMGRAVGVRGPVTLLRSADAAMPLTWGAFRPAVLLPAGADGWTAERRRVVLLHELAHVARRDCLMQTLAEAACAVWWFHPGAWWAARRMRVEREQACDDQVLAAGARASDYAGHLLDVARAYRSPALAAAVAMARPSHLEGRVRAVLAAERDRRAVTRRTAAVCAGMVLLASLPLAAIAPSERPHTPQAVAWQMPPARTQGGEYRIEVSVDTSNALSRSIPTLASVRSTRASEMLAQVAPASASVPTLVANPSPATRPVRVAQRTQEAPRAHPARHEPRHDRLAVTASVDARGNVRARVHLPEGLDVRVEGHGVRSVGNELEVDFNVSRAISLLSQSEGESGDRPKPARPRKAERLTRIAAEVQREVRRDKHDLALHILSGVNADAENADEPPLHAGKAAAEETAGG